METANKHDRIEEVLTLGSQESQIPRFLQVQSLADGEVVKKR